MRFIRQEFSVKHQRIVPGEELAEDSERVHRYGASQPWSVAVLALSAVAGAVVITGGMSSILPWPSAVIDLDIPQRLDQQFWRVEPSGGTAVNLQVAKAVVPK